MSDARNVDLGTAEHLLVRALVGWLNEGNGGVPAARDLLDISRIIADMDQAEAAKGIAFVNDQNVVSAGEKCGALFRMRPPRVAEKFAWNLQRGRRRSGPRPHEFGSLRFRLLDGRRSGGENIAVRAGILRFANLLQKIQVKPRFLDVERLEFRIRREHAGKSGDLRPAGEIVIPGVGNQENQGRENVKFGAPRHMKSGPKKRVQFELQAQTAGGYGFELHLIQKIKVLGAFNPVDEPDHRRIIGLQAGGN